MVRRMTLLVVASALVLGMEAAVQPDPAAAAHPGENGRLAYSDYSGIWTVNPDGSDAQRLTTAPENHEDRLPQWSPGGTNIVFQRTQGVPTEIWIVGEDGTDERLLFEPQDDWDYAPAWSPDSARITFTSSRPPRQAPLGHPRLDIWTANPDGSGTRRLTFDAVDGTTAELSRWSPTRDWIGFQVWTGFDADSQPIELIRPAGTDRHVVAPRAAGTFSWSPDGSQIAYAFTGNGKTRIYILDIDDGSERILVQKTGGELSFPTWSPDGTTIAFLSGGGAFPLSNVHTVPVSGGDPTSIGIQAESIDWQPVPDFGLVDARFSTFESSIRWLHGEGLTAGCAIERYCPDRSVGRGELATFLSRALELPATAEDFFQDDDGTTHEDAINRVAAANIARGCGPNAFCPTARVTRAQLATFFVKAFDLPQTSEDHFVDDDSSTHESNINRLASSGIASGCAENRYCPQAPVTRGQLAAFVRRAIET